MVDLCLVTLFSIFQAFNDETRDIRASTKRLLREINEPLVRSPSVPRQLSRVQRAQRSQSAQPSSRSYSRCQVLVLC